MPNVFTGTARDIEDNRKKVEQITAEDEESIDKYPSVRAVVDYIESKASLTLAVKYIDKDTNNEVTKYFKAFPINVSDVEEPLE